MHSPLVIYVIPSGFHRTSIGLVVNVHWTGGLDGTIGQVWSLRMGCPLDRWTGQDSGTSLVSEGGMSNGSPHDVQWTGGLDGTVGKVWSLRVGCPMDVPWVSIGQVDWTGQWDKPGH